MDTHSCLWEQFEVGQCCRFSLIGDLAANELVE
jgi:hypothetical protein